MTDTEIKVDTDLLREYASRLKKVNSRLKALEGDLEALYRREGLLDIGAILRSGNIRWNKTIDGAAQYLLDTADDFDRVEREIGALLDSSMQGEFPFAVFDEGGIGGGLDHIADNPTEPPGLSELYEQIYSMMTAQQRQRMESGEADIAVIFGELNAEQQNSILQSVQGFLYVTLAKPELPEYIREAAAGSPPGLLEETYVQLVSNLIHTLKSDDLVTGCGVIPPALKEAWIEAGHDPYLVESMLSNYITGDGNFASMSYTYNKPNLVEVFLLGKLIKALDTDLLKVTAPEGEFTPFRFLPNESPEVMEETVVEGAGQAINGNDSRLQQVFDAADNYTLSENTFNDHIIDRHGPDSKYVNKSHFNSRFDIKAGIDSTLKGDKSIVKPNTSGSEGYIFEQTFTDTIGTSSKGKALNTLKVVINENGNVITAFPTK